MAARLTQACDGGPSVVGSASLLVGGWVELSLAFICKIKPVNGSVVLFLEGNPLQSFALSETPSPASFSAGLWLSLAVINGALPGPAV